MLNALNESHIIDYRHMNHFSLGKEINHWKLFHQKSEIENSTSIVPDLSKAITNFRRVFVAINFDHELTICISFYGDFRPDYENDCDGKIDIYGFNWSGTISTKKCCYGDYRLFYNESHLQIYVSNKSNTFVWFGLPKKLPASVITLNELSINSSISVAID